MTTEEALKVLKNTSNVYEKHLLNTSSVGTKDGLKIARCGEFLGAYFPDGSMLIVVGDDATWRSAEEVEAIVRAEVEDPASPDNVTNLFKGE